MKIARIQNFIRLLLITITLLPAIRLSAAFSIAKGNLYVYQIGDGNTNGYASATAAAPIIIDEFSTNGVLLNSVELPTNGPVVAIASLNSSTEGSLSLSPVGDALVFMGYTNDGSFFVGKASVNSSGTATNTRSVLSVSANGTFFVASANTNFYKPAAGAGRGATTDGNGNYWAVGAGAGGTNGFGVDYYGTNSFPGQLAGTAQGLATPRTIQFYGTNLYFTAGTLLSSLPAVNVTNGPVAPTTVISDGGTPEGFVFNTNLTICYIAEGAATPGGIRRYDFDSVNLIWTNSYTFSPGTGFGFVTADFTGDSPVIYATTLVVSGGANQVVKFVDSGAGSGSFIPPAATVLVTSPTNNLNYNGIVFDSVAAAAAPLLPVELVSPQVLSSTFSFALTNTSGLNFKVYAATNIALPLSNWTLLGSMTESPASSGDYQFTDLQPANNSQQFYQVRFAP